MLVVRQSGHLAEDGPDSCHCSIQAMQPITFVAISTHRCWQFSGIKANGALEYSLIFASASSLLRVTQAAGLIGMYLWTQQILGFDQEHPSLIFWYFFFG